jgi:hypothetical protein
MYQVFTFFPKKNWKFFITLRNFPFWNDFGMKNLARFFLKKVDNVSDFVFHLKNVFAFHVLAEFFAQGFGVWNKME